MRSKSLLFMPVVFATVVVSPSRLPPLHAQSSEPVTLTGLASSAEEGHMEGVLVSARKINSTVPTTVTTTVVTDKEGRYRFPASRLEPGQYALRVRAVGYDVVGTGGAVTARLTAKPTTVDLKLRKTKHPAAQLTNAEWFARLPGTDA